MDKLYEGAYELYVTNDILLEYEEKMEEVFPGTAELILGSFALLDVVKKTEVYFHLNIISVDADDNKFVDCAFAANANFIVTEDKHFNVLKSTSFPSIKIIRLRKFMEMLIPPGTISRSGINLVDLIV